MASSVNTSQSFPIPTTDQLQEKPWRYIGYKGFSEWSASDNDFFVIRRFDSLATRVILLLQWQLTKLEKELTKADTLRSHQLAKDLNNGSFKCDDEVRQAVIKAVQDKLEEYCRCS
jgi:hypothetical protein